MGISCKAPPRGDRNDRLRAALRENLKRRKAQAKSRAERPAPLAEDAAAALNSAGIAGDKLKR
jgi:hypothetical protein